MELTRESEETLQSGWSKLSMRRRRSVTSAESSNSVEEGSEKQEDREYFPATQLFEYHWPLGADSPEHYMLQEQVAVYLDIRGIQRKYPDLQRRSLDLEERKYLLGRGVVTETQSNMGLVALVSDEVLQLMVDEFPRKYEEYMDVVQEREFQAALHQKIMETKRVALMGAQTSGSPRSITSEALQRTVEFNTKLAEQRRTLRKQYFDSQTRILQVPRKYPRVEEPSDSSGYPSRYPVALLPNQYSDYYRTYSAEEMRKLPIRTALELPPKTSDGVTAEAVPTSLAEQSSQTQTSSQVCDTVRSGPLASQGSSISAESTIQVQSGKLDPSTSSVAIPTPTGTKQTIQPKLDPSTSSVAIPTPTGTKQTIQPKSLNLRLALCTVCFKGRAANKLGEPEELIQCANCSRTIHPSCYELSKTAGDVAKTYAWQCLECKTCQVCGDPDEEDKMVCCDECDRGYHSFCVGLTSIPSGQWLCRVCGSCACCGTKSAGSNPTSRWKHEYASGKFLQTLCVQCSKYFRMGYFCPVCLKVYHNDKSDSPMVCCDECDRWIHTECDDISKEKYQQLSEDKLPYTCCLCRGEVDEKLNTFHKKYRSIG